MMRRRRSDAVETLYHDSEVHERARVAASGSPSLSLTFGQVEALYVSIATAAAHVEPLALAHVETIARDLGLWPVQLDIICQLCELLAGPARPANGPVGLAFHSLDLASFAPLLEDEVEGLSPEDVISVARLVPGRPGPTDVFSTIAVERLRETLSSRALRALDLRDLRHILEGLSTVFAPLHMQRPEEPLSLEVAAGGETP